MAQATISLRQGSGGARQADRENLYNGKEKNRLKSGNFAQARSHASLQDEPLISRTTACSCGGGCPDCAKRNQGTVRTIAPSPEAAGDRLPLQAKFKIGLPGDPYEQEADRITSEMMKMPAFGGAQPGLSRQPRGAGQQCTKCSQEKAQFTLPDQNKFQIRRKPESSGFDFSVSSGFISSLGDGRSMNQGERSFFEPRFGADLSNVRIHEGSRAAELAYGINARAFTLGNRVVMGAGEYGPGSSSGQRLLAHELVHVGQQTGLSAGAGPPALGKFSPGDAPGDSIQRVHPGVVAGGAFAAGVAIGIASFEAALAYARSLASRYPGWLGVLPNCPCSEATVRANSSTWSPDQNPALSWFHPGAASSYRSASAYSSVAGTSHGQQCTYDSSGELVTEGPGAGTPDVWSPNTHTGDHMLYDVTPWQLLGWRIYNRYWRPNNGNSCSTNRGDSGFMRDLSEFLP